MNSESKRKQSNPVVSFIALAIMLSPTIAAAESAWEVTANIYLWAPKITVETPGGKGATLPFYQILDDLEMTFMGGVKAQKGQWSIATDAVYMDLNQRVNRDASFTPGQTDVTGDVGLKSWIVTPTLGYAVHDTDDVKVDAIIGTRYLWLDSSAKVAFEGETQFDKSVSASYWDVVFGARAEFILSDKWFVPTYFDIGTGQTDLTWQTYAGIGYKFGKVSTILGYRYLTFEFSDNQVMADMTVKGPVAAMTFNF